MTTHTRPRTAAITGAGTGLGRETALALADKGYRVFGTARATSEVDALQAASHGRGEEATEILRLVRNQPLAELDRLRLRLVGSALTAIPLQSPMRRASKETHLVLCARRRLAPREAFHARVKLNNAPVRA